MSYRQDEVRELLPEIQNGMNQLSRWAATYRDGGLEDSIRAAEERERKLFSLLRKKFQGENAAETIKKLEAHLAVLSQNYRELMGLNLRSLVVEAITTANSENKTQKQEDFQEAFEYHLHKVGKQMRDMTPEGIAGYLTEILQAGVSQRKKVEGKGKGGRTFSEKKLGLVFNGNQVRYGMLTKDARDVMDKFIKEYKTSKQKFGFTQTNTSNGILIKTTWVDLITEDGEILTPTKAKELDLKGVIKVDEINGEITNVLLSHIKSDKNIFADIINRMLSKDRYMFFTGYNAGAATGIIGEIFAQYFLESVFAYGKSRVQWSATDLEKGKKLSVDFVIKELGIQVKNTTKEIIKNFKIDFMELNLRDFLGRLPGLPMGANTVLNGYYAIYSFNVTYHDNFIPTRSEIESKLSQLDQLYESFAAILLFIEAGEGFRKIPTTIFLLGGQIIKAASSILRDIQQSVNGHNLKVSSYLEKGGKTIVDVLHTRMDTHMEDYLKKVILKTSYTFNPG